jgi:hypothetical protein
MELMTIVAVILGSLLSLSEILSLIPGIKSNGIFQLIVNSIRSIKDALFPKKDPA